MLSTPITEQTRQQEWDIIGTTARNNDFQLQIIHNLRNKIIRQDIQTQRKKWITFTYHSPLIHKVTNLFKRTDLSIAFRKCNIIYNQLCDTSPQNKINSSGIYRLQCKTCKKSYVGQTGGSIETRHREHIRYTKKTSLSIGITHFSITDTNMVFRNVPCNY